MRKGLAPSLSRGFTLIELLVVIAIIIIIAALIIINLAAARGKGRDSRRVQDLDSIRTAVESFQDDNSAIPVVGDNTVFTSNAEKWQRVLGAALKPYLTAVPKDPINDILKTPGSTYRYTHRVVDKQDVYELDALMERNTKTAENDGGDNDSRYEIGTDLTLLGV